jgi:hypothetical protein
LHFLLKLPNKPEMRGSESLVEMSETLVENRMHADRRTLGWRTVFYGFLRSRRRLHRREEETELRFIDWHHPWLFFLAIGTMLLSVLDAFMTLQLIDRGMVEVNPVMAAVIGHGTAVFAASKLFLTAIGVLALVFLAKARFLNRVRTGLFLTMIFGFYACLVCYEFVFLLQTI